MEVQTANPIDVVFKYMQKDNLVALTAKDANLKDVLTRSDNLERNQK